MASHLIASGHGSFTTFEDFTTTMSNPDTISIEENLGLTGSETVGVIIAIVSGATILIILLLLASMGFRYWFHRRRSGSLDIELSTSSRNLVTPKKSILKSPSSNTGEGNVDTGSGYRLNETNVTSNTFLPLTQPPPEEESSLTSPAKVEPDGGIPNGHVPMAAAAQLELYPPQPQPKQFHRDDLMLQEKLGEGEYGPIYRGEAYGLGSHGESKSVTVKMLSQYDDNESREMFNQDIEMLSSISHLNVVGLLALCTKDTPECILLDAGIPGDLLTYMRDKKNGVSQLIATESETKELLRIADEISLGMAYLASERFIHKDLALRNCVIDFDGVVKIAHFGLGPLIYPEAYYRVNDTDLPIRWMSPEAITSASFTTMSDIWSFGVTVWELFTYGSLPFEGRGDEDVIDLVLHEGRLGKPAKCSNNIFALVQSCWKTDPLARPSFFDLHDTLTDLSRIQSPLSALGPATPISPLSPITPTGPLSTRGPATPVSPLSPITPTGTFGIGNSAMPSTFK